MAAGYVLARTGNATVVVNGANVRLARVWAKDEPFGAEFADIILGDDTLTASGIAIGSEPLPYRLEYELTTLPGYVTRRLQVSSRGAGWRRNLVLERDPVSNAWSSSTEAVGELDLPAPGGDLSGLNDALDCDLGLSALTNSMPVLRHELHRRAQRIEFLMAWVAVPSLTVSPSPQRYTSTSTGIVRYESLDSDFSADITFDQHGIVLDYPGIARAVNTAHGQTP